MAPSLHARPCIRDTAQASMRLDADLIAPWTCLTPHIPAEKVGRYLESANISAVSCLWRITLRTRHCAMSIVMALLRQRCYKRPLQFLL